MAVSDAAPLTGATTRPELSDGGLHGDREVTDLVHLHATLGSRGRQQAVNLPPQQAVDLRLQQGADLRLQQAVDLRLRQAVSLRPRQAVDLRPQQAVDLPL